MRLMMLALPIALAGCAPIDRETTTGQREPISLRDEGDECGASLVSTYVGLRATTQLRSDVTTRSAAKSVRWIVPDSAVTMDYRPDRLNVELDRDDKILRFTCG